MPTEAPTKPKRETWRDWMSPEAPEPTELLSRDELVNQLRQEGIKVSAADLRNWQDDGIVPYGIRRWYQGATRTLYPPWMAYTIRELREMQATGLALPEIKQRLRVAARQRTTPIPLAGTAIGTSSSTATLTLSDSLSADVTETVSVVRTPPPDIETHLRQWAQAHEAVFGIRIARIDVSLVDERGHPLTFHFDT